MSRAKYDSITSKKYFQKNKLNKQCLKFKLKTPIQSQCFYCQLWIMSGHVIYLKLKLSDKYKDKIEWKELEK